MHTWQFHKGAECGSFITKLLPFPNVLSYIFVATFSPDSNDLAPVEIDPVHLRDEDGGDGLIKRRAVHVDCGTDWEDETRYSLVDAQVLLQASEGDRQGTSTAGGKIREDASYYHGHIKHAVGLQKLTETLHYIKHCQFSNLIAWFFFAY